MRNLGILLTKSNVIAALEQVIKEKPDLLKAKKFSLVYNGQAFPPKEIARLAAMAGGLPVKELSNYRLSGGDSINQFFRKLGFEIQQFKDSGLTLPSQKKEPARRLSRLCWNFKGWVTPSGWEGKSVDKESHEARFGYGHEEWLFDTGKLIGGYHYGFLEAVRKQMNAYQNKTYDVTFYSINGITKTRCWAGRIKELEVLNHEKADDIKKEYQRQNWLADMETEIKIIQSFKKGITRKGWSSYQGVDIFNVRFKPENLDVTNMYFPIAPDSPIIKYNRYSFPGFTDAVKEPPTDQKMPFSFKGTNKPLNPLHDGDPLKKTFNREPVAVEITFLHQKISNGLTRKLRTLFGNSNADPNCQAGFMGREIDIVANDQGTILFYEIKTYNSLMQSIRVAIGQIMEYALWTDEVRADKWIIVTQPHKKIEETAAYFKHLRDTYDLPLYYQTYDWETDELSPLI